MNSRELKSTKSSSKEKFKIKLRKSRKTLLLKSIYSKCAEKLKRMRLTSNKLNWRRKLELRQMLLHNKSLRKSSLKLALPA